MVLSALLGAVFGSFLNVVIYRLPLGMSLALPPSHCPVCGEKLKWYHNIPVLSYIFLRGKCAFCKTRISPRYIFVELLNCFLWLICYLLYGNTLFTFTAMIFLSVLICVFFIDSEHMIIPDSLNIIIALLGLILALFGNNALSASPLDRILTAIGMLCFGLLLFFSFKFFAKKKLSEEEISNSLPPQACSSAGNSFSSPSLPLPLPAVYLSLRQDFLPAANRPANLTPSGPSLPLHQLFRCSSAILSLIFMSVFLIRRLK